MPLILALLSLLGGCSGMLDLPDRPRVNTETVAPLEPQPGGSRSWHDWGQQTDPATPSDSEPALVDAGTTLEREAAPADAGLEVRVSSR